MADQLDVINNILAVESGRFGPDIYERTVATHPIMGLVREGDWPEGMGDTIKVLTWSRMLPADTTTLDAKRITWSDVTFSADDPDGFFGGSAGTAANGSCLPPTTNLPTGFSTKEYKLQHAALETPMMCVNDLRNSFKRTETLRAMKNAMVDTTAWVLTQRYFQLFYSNCTRHILVSTTNGYEESTTMPTGSGKTASVLKQGVLTKVYGRLTRAGAHNSPGMLKEDGGPVFTALIGMEASRLIKQETNYRDDMRWNADRVPELLKALGAIISKPLLGFLHVIDVQPNRWNYDGGWVWVPPYTYEQDSGSGQYVMIENPDYETATWEDTIVFHPDVFHAVFPGSISAAGSGAEFEPVKYRGDWNWVNIKDRTRNIDGTIGNFRGVFTLGGKPVFPNYGAVIRHARCDLTPVYAACAAN